MATTTWHAVIHGTVQGVGFRWFVREQAVSLGLVGWVRNRPDGSVELVARGEPAQLERFKSMVRRGPRGAVVDSMQDLEYDGAIGDAFEIVR